jgi:hypothetical protein
VLDYPAAPVGSPRAARGRLAVCAAGVVLYVFLTVCAAVMLIWTAQRHERGAAAVWLFVAGLLGMRSWSAAEELWRVARNAPPPPPPPTP